MCGIAGFIEFGEPSSSTEDLLRMQQVIRHRGPNDQGYYFEPGIGLCHTRLSIVDLSKKARQPMMRDDLILVYNGEIYNFKELRKELEALGHQFVSNSDTEVLLEAFRRWNKDVLLRLNGMFAFVVYDKRAQTLFLARDRSGIKPLVYYDDGSRFVFGSEVKAITAYPHFKKNLSLEGLEDYLRLGHTTGKQTIWERCYCLAPGQYMTVDLKTRSRKIHSYFEPHFSSQGDLNFLETKKQLKSLLIDELQKSLVSDVPVGACISGGVDSNVLISLLTKELGVSLRTFSLSSNEAQFDENIQAQGVAKHLGLDHRSISLDPKTCRETLIDTIIHYDEPFADQNILSYRYIAKAARKEGVPVLLSGIGGDELFFGYPNVELRAKMPMLYKMPAFLRRAVSKELFPYSNKMYKSIHLAQQPDYLSAIMDISGNCFFDDEIERLMLQRSGSESSCNTFIRNNHSANGTSLVEKIMLFDYRVFLGEHGLLMADISSMAEGIEMRVPYLNNSILDFGLSIPSRIKKHNGTFKALLRDIEAEYLPADLVYGGKRGFYPFIKTVWLNEHFKDEVNTYFSPERFKKQGIFNYKTMDDIFRIHQNTKINMGNKLWNMLIFQVWADKNL